MAGVVNGEADNSKSLASKGRQLLQAVPQDGEYWLVLCRSLQPCLLARATVRPMPGAAEACRACTLAECPPPPPQMQPKLNACAPCMVHAHAHAGALRLLGGDGVSNGTLEIFHQGQWGSICQASLVPSPVWGAGGGGAGAIPMFVALSVAPMLPAGQGRGCWGPGCRARDGRWRGEGCEQGAGPGEGSVLGWELHVGFPCTARPLLRPCKCCTLR